VSIQLTTSATSQTGARSHNEDAFVVSPKLLAVADGMGGHRAGEVASGVVATALLRLGQLPILDRDDVLVALRRCNDELLVRSRDREGTGRMGTTITGVALIGSDDDTRLLVFNAGDSRTYLMRDGVLRQITTDHSIVQELITSGELQTDDARSHPQRNVITRSIGADFAVDIDTFELDARDADRLLLCSDGVTSALREHELSALLAIPDRDIATERIVEAALNAGSRDNVTAVLIDVEGVYDTPARPDEKEDTQPRAITQSTSEAAHDAGVIDAVPFDLDEIVSGE